MNCISACKEFLRLTWPALALLAVAACGVSDSESAGPDAAGEYAVHYTLRPVPSESAIIVELRVEQAGGLLRELSFPADHNIDQLEGNGELVIYDGRVRWQPPGRGGSLRWRAIVHNERDQGAFDALLTPEWGVFRMEDVIPRARTRTIRGARSRTTVGFDLPKNWSAVSEYAAAELPILVDRPARRFDEPAGWVAVGKLGVRRETISGIPVAVAGPRDHGVRRMDMLALLNWTLPELASILPGALTRLTIISAGEPMWRGGLSAPASFYLHADRPLISENATSPVLHETMHTALSIQAKDGFDWITEGLAEYYSIELLRRGNAITAGRAAAAYAEQADWGAKSTALCGGESTGETTALAVTVFAALDKEISTLTEGAASLDALLPLIVGKDVDLDSLARAASKITGAAPDTLRIDSLPGCRNLP
jgi:hypothetical protein